MAVVSNYNGEVKVQHNGVWSTVARVGNRIRNSSVYNGDTIATAPGAKVDLIFSDNTTLKVEADTTLTISTRQVTSADREKEGFVRNVAGTRQEVVRNVNVKAGKVWASITPSKSILTEFESPTGVASVRGTVLTFAFLGGVTGIDLINGLLDFISALNNVGVNFDSGDALNISETGSGQTKVDVASGDITLTTSEGTITVGDGGALDLSVDPDTGAITVNSTAGNVTITTPEGTTTPVVAGDNLGTTGSGNSNGDNSGGGSGGSGNGDNSGGNGDSGGSGNTDGSNGPSKNPDPFFGTSPSQSNQTQQESTTDDEEEDTDGDGVPDSEDAFPNDPDETTDTDGDGVGDNGDAFPNDASEDTDTDGDGVGDNGDAFPNDASETTDTDGDGIGDNADAFPNDSQTFWEDNFSSGNLDKWNTTTNAYVGTSFGPITAPGIALAPINDGNSSDDDNQFAVVHTGQGNQADTGKIIKEFDFQVAGTRHVTADVNFVTTEDPSATGTVLTFDDTGSGSIPDGYGGLNWSSQFRHLNGTSHSGSGYENGIVSGTQVAFNGFASPINTSKSSGTWDFTGTYISAAWRDGLQVTFTGLLSGSQLFSSTISVDHTGPNWRAFNFTGIDTLSISSTGGTEVSGLSGSGAHFALDNFTINGVSSNNDYFKAELILSDGSTIELAYEDVHTSTLTAVAGLPTTVLDNSSGYQTGWKSIDWTGFVPAGLTQLIFGVYDAGDSLNDSAVLIDNVVDPLVDDIIDEMTDDTQPTVPNPWMTFARMIRDDIDVDEMDIAAGLEGNPEHQAYAENVDNAIVDLEESPGSLNLTEIFGNIWTEKSNIFDSEYTQHASVAMLLLTANELAESENGIEVNLNAIKNSLSLAQSFMGNHINDFGDSTVHKDISLQIDSLKTKVGMFWNNIYDTSSLAAIKSEVQEAFCSVIDHTIQGNTIERENPFHFCHGNMDEGG